LMLVSQRRGLLDYLKREDPQRYVEILRRLQLRK
jgi:ribosomal protein S15P/S13E